MQYFSQLSNVSECCTLTIESHITAAQSVDSERHCSVKLYELIATRQRCSARILSKSISCVRVAAAMQRVTASLQLSTTKQDETLHMCSARLQSALTSVTTTDAVIM